MWQWYPRSHSSLKVVEHAPRQDPGQSTNDPENSSLELPMSHSSHPHPSLTTSTFEMSSSPSLAFLSSTPSYTSVLSSSLSQSDQFPSTSSLPSFQSDASSSLAAFQSDASSSSGGEYSTTSPNSSSSIPTYIPSNAASSSGNLPTNTPSVTSSVQDTTHVGIIVGGVLGALVAALFGITTCYFLLRKKRRLKIGYNNLPSDDERRYLQGLEDDPNWGRYSHIHDLHAHNEQSDIYYESYPLQDLTANDRGHNVTFTSVEGEEWQSVQMQSPGVRTSDVEGLISPYHIESDSPINDFGEGTGAKMTSNLGTRNSSSTASIRSWARTAFEFAVPNVSTGNLSTTSRTTVDIHQISGPRPLQKWQRPKEPKRGSG